ncbi:MAG: hypothetical protein KGJ38_08210 [Burkholderiaceae bacterium]|nr:hypothetical protein [Burkholderiaceae bacterium]
MMLEDWALRWGISWDALHDLKTNLLRLDGLPAAVPGMSEAAVQSRVRLEAAAKGLRLWRNNVGALEDKRGIPVRFGLANDSAALNKVLKSHDLIGLRPTLITQAHVGRTLGLFVSREIKEGSWHYTGTEHEIAQLNWANLINSFGGDAAFANAEGSL